MIPPRFTRNARVPIDQLTARITQLFDSYYELRNKRSSSIEDDRRFIRDTRVGSRVHEETSTETNGGNVFEEIADDLPEYDGLGFGDTAFSEDFGFVIVLKRESDRVVRIKSNEPECSTTATVTTDTLTPVPAERVPSYDEQTNPTFAHKR